MAATPTVACPFHCGKTFTRKVRLDAHLPKCPKRNKTGTVKFKKRPKDDE